LTTVESRKTTVDPRIVATSVMRCWRDIRLSVRTCLLASLTCGRDL
jgi:hypothetical protein